MAEVRRFPELLGLNKLEVHLILTLIIECEDKLDLVKEQVKGVIDKDIPIETIQQLRAKYPDRIKQMQRRYEEELLRNPLASRNVRLHLLYKVVKNAMEIKPRGSFKVGKDDYEIRDDWDNKVIIDAIMAAEKICENAEKSRIAWAKIEGSVGDDYDFEALNPGPVTDGLEEVS